MNRLLEKQAILDRLYAGLRKVLKGTKGPRKGSLSAMYDTPAQDAYEKSIEKALGKNFQRQTVLQGKTGPRKGSLSAMYDTPAQDAYEKSVRKVKKAHFQLKTASLDLNRLTSLGAAARLGERPGIVEFTTPEGHTVKTPYTEETIRHQIARMGGEDPYYQTLATAIKHRGIRADKDIRNEREAAAHAKRVNNAILGGTVGALGGALLGATKNAPGIGLLAGGGLGAAAGYLAKKYSPETSPTTRKIREMAELYAEPEHVKETRKMQAQQAEILRQIKFQQDMDRFSRAFAEPSPYRYYGF
jgi:hypothetical protein